MKKKQRLSGIDLCRGIAAYAVILVHSGDETWGVPVGEWTSEFRSLFYFAVPFFLATSFYLMTRKIDSKVLSWGFWNSRSQRILIPCAIWSVIYLIARSILFSVSHQSERLQKLFQDPLAIIFFGGASYHLYFLPLLFTGSFSILIAYYLVKQKVDLKVTIFLLVLSLVIYELNLDSGNAFQLSSYTAFQNFLNSVSVDGIGYHFLRIIFVQIAFIVTCLPYLFAAMSLQYILLGDRQRKLQNNVMMPVCLGIFLFANTWAKELIPSALNGILLGYSLLLMGISLGDRLNENKAIKNLGLCFFGIYLIHPLSMNIIKILMTRIAPQLTIQITIISMLVISLSSFFLSWWIVSILIKNEWLARYMFGTTFKRNTQVNDNMLEIK